MSPTLAEAIQEAQAEWQFHDYVRFLRQHWGWLLCCGALGWGLAWIYATQLPNLYEARATILIERSAVEPLRFADPYAAAAMRDIEFLATEQQLITKRPVLEQVMQELNLAGFPPFSTSRDPLAVLANMVHVAPVRQTKLVDVVAVAGNPALAMRIANATAQVYMQRNLERSRQSVSGGAHWLREELARAETKMKTAQEALQQFKEEHKMVSLEDRQNVVVQRLKELSSAATAAQTARLKAEAEQAEIARALAAGSPPETIPIVQATPLVQTLKAQLSVKEGELADRLKIYGARHPVIVQLTAEIDSIKQQIRAEAQRVFESARLEYTAAGAREQELRQAQAEQERLALELNRLELTYTNLTREAEAATELYGAVGKRLKELEVTESLQANNVRIIDEAQLPQRPVAPNRARIHFIGLLLGVAAGGLGAYLRTLLSRTIHTRQDVETALRAPFLGHFLHVAMPRGRGGSQATLFFAEDPESQAAEGVRAMRTTLEFLLPEAPAHRFLITSSVPEEGKSLVSANLAVSLQELGRSVVLIDADMRRPSLFRTFQVTLEPGLSAYLQGQASLQEILQLPPTTHGVTVIASGAVPARPADLLAGPRMAQLLQELSTQFQYIIIDTPPVLAVADAMILARQVDGVLLVARAKKTTRDALVAAYQQISQAHPKLHVTLLNDVRPGRDRGYHYRYDYYRGESSRAGTPEPNPLKHSSTLGGNLPTLGPAA